jgi:hypothetical protein
MGRPLFLSADYTDCADYVQHDKQYQCNLRTLFHFPIMRRYHASPRNSQITRPKIRVAIYRANLCNPQTIYPGFTGRFVRKGSQIAPKGIADLLLKGCGAAPAHGHGAPESPVFCGAKKSAPNAVL